jgi:hypothetical protein
MARVMLAVDMDESVEMKSGSSGSTETPARNPRRHAEIPRVVASSCQVPGP